MYTRERAILEYTAELEAAEQAKASGQLTVVAEIAGEELARGRDEVPIEEVITDWKAGLKALTNGADPEAYNF